MNPICPKCGEIPLDDVVKVIAKDGAQEEGFRCQKCGSKVQWRGS